MAEVLILINKLLPKMQNLIIRAENLESTCSAQDKNEVKALKKGLIENKLEVEQIGEIAAGVFEHNLKERQRLEEMVTNVTCDNEYALKRITELEGEIFRLDGNIEKLEDDLQTVRKEVEKLQFDQIASHFERDLALYLYPYGKKIGSDQVFIRMKEWLEKKKETPQGKEANEKWESLKQKVSWSSMHEDVLSKMRSEVHRDVELHGVASPGNSHSSEDIYNDEERKCIRDIKNITKEVNDMM